MSNRLVCAVLLVVSISLLCPQAVVGKEFAPLGIESASVSLDSYYSSLYVPALEMDEECEENEDGENENCDSILRDNGGDDLKRFNSASLMGQSRYRNSAYGFVKEIYDCGILSVCSNFHIFNNQGENWPFQGEWNESDYLDLAVKQDRTLVVVSPDGIKHISPSGDVLLDVPVPRTLKQATLQTDLDGNLAAIAIDSQNTVWLSNGDTWSESTLTLTRTGDRKEILSVYPLGDTATIGAVYSYENPSRKGVTLVKSRYDQPKASAQPILLSTDRNVGWSPESFVKDDTIYITSKDSTNENKVQIAIPKQKVWETTIPEPDPEDFPPGGKVVSFTAGGGLMWRNWRASSEVEKNDKTYTQIDYNIESTFLKSLRFQGRIGTTRYVLNYLRQFTRDKAEEKFGETASEGVEQFLGSVEFEGFFSPSSSLQLRYKRSETDGLATVKRRGQPDSAANFSVEFNQYGLYHVTERGYYYTFKYTDYTLPSAVGFSNQDGDIVYSNLDRNLGLQKYNLALGYDPLSYLKRYETEYSDWFMTGEFGLGAVYANVSERIRDEAKAAASADSIETPLFFSLDGSITGGYVWQDRLESFGHLGTQILAGYRASGSHIKEGRDEEQKDLESLTFELERNDLWHGPVFTMNIIF